MVSSEQQLRLCRGATCRPKINKETTHVIVRWRDSTQRDAEIAPWSSHHTKNLLRRLHGTTAEHLGR